MLIRLLLFALRTWFAGSAKFGRLNKLKNSERNSSRVRSAIAHYHEVWYAGLAPDFAGSRRKAVLFISAWWSPRPRLCIHEAVFVLFLELQIIADYLYWVMVMRFGNFMPDRSYSFNCWIILH